MIKSAILTQRFYHFVMHHFLGFPIMKKIVFLFLLLFFIFPSHAFTILLHPAGHAGEAGRMLSQNCERAMTYEWALALQKELNRQFPDWFVYISRTPGETLYPLQIASYANRLPAHLTVSLHLFKQETTKPEPFLYTLSYSPLRELYSGSNNLLSFIPLEKAHYKQKKLTLLWAKQVATSLKKTENNDLFNCYNVQSLPFKPFFGMMYPALGIELGVKNDTDWQRTVKPLMESLMFLLS
jgi:N-acetylmuramoyl-L-alanine amidase